MKKTRHTPNQIITKLRNVEAARAEGRTVADAVRDIGVVEQTYHRWKREYGSMDRNQVKRLNDLKKENAWLKKVVDFSLDKDVVKEALEGNTEPDPQVSCRSSRPRELGRQRATGLPNGWATPLDSDMNQNSVSPTDLFQTVPRPPNRCPLRPSGLQHALLLFHQSTVTRDSSSAQ